MLEYIYLASPYSHVDCAVVEERVEKVLLAAAKLMQRGSIIFSPIAHSHFICKAGNLPATWEFWEKQDMPFLSRADELWVLMLPGWEESKGIAAEIAYAKKCHIPVWYVRPDSLQIIVNPEHK